MTGQGWVRTGRGNQALLQQGPVRAATETFVEFDGQLKPQWTFLVCLRWLSLAQHETDLLSA